MKVWRTFPHKGCGLQSQGLKDINQSHSVEVRSSSLASFDWRRAVIIESWSSSSLANMKKDEFHQAGQSCTTFRSFFPSTFRCWLYSLVANVLCLKWPAIFRDFARFESKWPALERPSFMPFRHLCATHTRLLHSSSSSKIRPAGSNKSRIFQGDI